MPQTDNTIISLQLLGQSGCRLEYGNTIIYLDPYLSNSVQKLDGPDLERLIPIPIQPSEVNDADWVLITHEHIDHCDPHTLPLIAEASRQCRFVGPYPVIKRLKEWGISDERCLLAAENWTQLNASINLRAVPAAHPVIQRDPDGLLAAVGYLVEIDSKRLYLAGDTSVAKELIDTLKSLSPIGTVMMPVNEQNYFRNRRGIIGNMSIREAFLLTEEIEAAVMIPVHWDMFAVNSVDKDEIKAVYSAMKPAFDLHIQPTSIVL